LDWMILEVFSNLSDSMRGVLSCSSVGYAESKAIVQCFKNSQCVICLACSTVALCLSDGGGRGKASPLWICYQLEMRGHLGAENRVQGMRGSHPAGMLGFLFLFCFDLEDSWRWKSLLHHMISLPLLN